MRAHSCLALMALLLSPVVRAEGPVRGYAGAGLLAFSVEGHFTDRQTAQASPVDLNEDLGIDGDQGGYYYLGVEHSLPWIPCLRLSHSDMQEQGENRLRTTIIFDGQVFAENSRVLTDADLSHTDLTLYYPLHQGDIRADLGLSGRLFDGAFQTVGSNRFGTIVATRDVNFMVPLIFTHLRLSLPHTGLYLATEAQGIAQGSSHFYDLWLKTGHDFAFGLGLEIGYRRMTLRMDDLEQMDANIQFDAPYLALRYRL